MQILKYLSRLFICLLCVQSLCTASFGASNIPFGDIGDYGNWITEDNMESFSSNIRNNATQFQEEFQNHVTSSDFVPIEVKIGLMFMKALSSLDQLLQISLVRFVIIFLITMYAFWVAIEAYKMIRESSDYKAVIYDVFKKGITIAIWILILNFGPAKIFMMIIGPIISFGTYLSDFILNTVTNSTSNTCAAIHNYVNNSPVVTGSNNGTTQLLLSQSADIMCLPGRLSVFFYHATSAALKWALSGFGQSVAIVLMGAVCVVIFIKCIFKYAFMTLGVVADLFLTLLMLPFTALAESLPSSADKSYYGKIFNEFLSIFSTKKVSDIITKFINAAIYFVSLAIIISICAALLVNLDSLAQNNYDTGSAMMAILCGCLVLYLADKADELAKKVGGDINNSFGEKLQNDVKTLWGDTKNVAGKLHKDWLKKK